MLSIFCLIHYYVTLKYRVGKSFYATETAVRFENKACQFERKGRLTNDEQDTTGLWDTEKSDSISSSK